MECGVAEHHKKIPLYPNVYLLKGDHNPEEHLFQEPSNPQQLAESLAIRIRPIRGQEDGKGCGNWDCAVVSIPEP